MKISVIIPVYQVEKYLHQCVDSVLTQSYKNVEIILIDDGSKDGSPEICDNYSIEDERVKVIHQENQGLSQARNSGIRVASGEYILFLDSDDYWDDKDALKRLVGRIRETNAEVLNYSYKKYMEDTGEKLPYFKDVPQMPLSCKNRIEQLEYLTRSNLYIASACNKMVKRTLFDEEFLFRSGVYSEDIEWCAKLLKKAKSQDFVCENFYCYRQRQDSIRHTINEKKCLDLCQNIVKCIEIANQSEMEIQEYLYRYSAFQYGTFFMVQTQAEHIPYEYIEILSRYSWILKYHVRNKKLLCLYMGCKVLGYQNLCKLIRMIYKNR